MNAGLVAADVAMEAGQIATTAALIGPMGGAMGGRRGGFGLAGPPLAGTKLGTTMGSAGGGNRKSYDFVDNYNFPVVALGPLFEHQPRDYQFNLEDRTFFDVAKVPSGVKVLNGDVGEDGARVEGRPSSRGCSPRRRTSSTTRSRSCSPTWRPRTRSSCTPRSGSPATTGRAGRSPWS